MKKTIALFASIVAVVCICGCQEKTQTQSQNDINLKPGQVQLYNGPKAGSVGKY